MKTQNIKAALLGCILMFANGAHGQFVAQNGLSVDTVSCTYNLQLGNDVGQTKARLLNAREIPMNGYNIMFNDNATSASSIGIGYPLGTAAPTYARFEVSNDSKPAAGYFVSSVSSPTVIVAGIAGLAQNLDEAYTVGVLGVSLGNTGYNSNVGVSGKSESSSNYNIGVDAVAANAIFQTLGIQSSIQNSGSPSNQGVSISLDNSTNAASENIGVASNVNSIGANNYGIYAIANGATINWGGYFAGDVYTTGSYLPSDMMLKRNITSLSGAMDIINKLEPKTYFYNLNEFPSMHLPQGLQYGLIAQDVATILPGFTKKAVAPAVRDKNHKTVHNPVEFTALNYTELIPILLGGVKEQQTIIDNQQKTINELQKKIAAQDATIIAMQEQLNRLAATVQNPKDVETSKSAVVVTNVTLADGESIVLDDNVPNPFLEQTSIGYYLPAGVVRAQIMFYNIEGKLIKTVLLENRGKGQINVFAADLSNGTYTYSLVADGRIIQTKKMVKQQ